MTSRGFASWPEEPRDVHWAGCNVWISNAECNCWHEDVRSFPRVHQDPGPDPNAQTEAVELPCDQDLNEASS